MTLKVFGVGFGRTGTESMKKALETIYGGPCYHMFEVLPHQDRVEEWVRLTQGKTPDWDAMFEGYHASVDWPGAFFWREIAAHFEDAKLILTIRDAESWYRSMSSTILPLVRQSAATPNSLATEMFIKRTFDGDIESEDHVKNVYNRHNAAVQAAFGPDRLLVYQLGSGWEPLCEFLGVNVPNVPYPHGNRTEDFSGNIERVRGTHANVKAA